MIGRSGLFAALACPFFSDGVCDRPYCHFKHVKLDMKQAKSDQGYKASFSAFPIAKTDEPPAAVVISQVGRTQDEEMGQSYRGSFFEPLPNLPGLHRPSLLGPGPPAASQQTNSRPKPEVPPVSAPPESEIAKSLEAVNQAIMQLQKTMQNASGTSALPNESTNAVVDVIKQVQNNLINGVKGVAPASGAKFNGSSSAVGSWRKLPSSGADSKPDSSCAYRPTPINQLEKIKSEGTTEEYSPMTITKQSKTTGVTKTTGTGLKQKADSSTDLLKKNLSTTAAGRPTTKPQAGAKRNGPQEKGASPVKRKLTDAQKGDDRVIATLRADLLKKSGGQAAKGSALLNRIKQANEVNKPPCSQPLTSSQSIIDMSDIFGDDSDSEDVVRSQAAKPARPMSKVKSSPVANRSRPTLVATKKPLQNNPLVKSTNKSSSSSSVQNGVVVTPPTADLDLDSLLQDDNFQFGLEADLDEKRASPDTDETNQISSTTSTLPIRVSGDKSTGKIRVAYKSASTDSAAQKRIEISRRPHVPTPAEQMYKRNVEAMNKQSELAKPGPIVESPPSLEQLYGPAKKLKTSGFYGSASTSGEIQRVAHVPRAQTTSSLKRPIIPMDFGAKIPSSIRQRYLGLMIDECLRFCKTEAEAHEKALAEEKSVFTKCSSKSVYLNAAVMAIKRMRDQNGLGSPVLEYADAAGLDVKQVLTDQKAKSSVSHDVIMGVKPGSQANFTVGLHRNRPKAKVSAVVKKDRYYEALQPYLLTKQQMVDNGYPIPDPDCPGKATILNSDANKIIANNNPHRICSRCGKQYQVDEDGFCITYEECTFHWGRAYKRKVIGSIDARYSCCQAMLGTEGCSVWKFHVSDAIFASSLEGYLGTVPPDEPPADGNYGVFALDCEMVYTTGGMELAKVTVINENNHIAYETIIRPYNAILDCNTRFSGLKQEDIDKIKTRLEDVQCHLLRLFSSETILIGHSLESDLKALKLFHTKIVDTAVVFPHRLGHPYKRALRNLALEFLQRIIQDEVGGHDSCEDARTCLDLMKYRLKEDATKAKYPLV